ncbi:MAG: hypothetical protein IKN57_08605, partial [Parasporobacterium sp.]|nr:hypothetical protein [Parasporobacterium sp.]
MFIRKTVKAGEEIANIVQFVREQLISRGIREDDVRKACLATEETAESLMEHASDGSVVVSIHALLGSVTIDLSAKGERFNPAEKIGKEHLLDDEVGEGAQAMIRSILLHSVAEQVRYRRILG